MEAVETAATADMIAAKVHGAAAITGQPSATF